MEACHGARPIFRQEARYSTSGKIASWIWCDGSMGVSPVAGFADFTTAENTTSNDLTRVGTKFSGAGTVSLSSAVTLSGADLEAATTPQTCSYYAANATIGCRTRTSLKYPRSGRAPRTGPEEKMQKYWMR